MAVSHLPLPLLFEPTETFFNSTSFFIQSTSLLPIVLSSSSSRKIKLRNIPLSPKFLRPSVKVKSKPEESEASLEANTFTEFKQLLLPVIDRNPRLSEGTKQATATTAALAKKYGAEITVIVIDEKEKESLSEHDTQLASIRWHLSEGGYQEFKLLERLGDGNKPTAILGEVADEMNMDLVVMSMEAIHSKHIDANLLVEFIPCPVLLLPL
ncbi:uncharacterized protein LOC142522323 [Primulina tabacum]|uniref:uncharacterized protein LOC142522323 n=1 Tax=Primulina tabacum TaxID=48773 RepID=UPI003F593633